MDDPRQDQQDPKATDDLSAEGVDDIKQVEGNAVPPARSHWLLDIIGKVTPSGCAEIEESGACSPDALIEAFVPEGTCKHFLVTLDDGVTIELAGCR